MKKVVAGVAVVGVAAGLLSGCGLATREFSDSDTGIGSEVRSVRLVQEGGSVVVRAGEVASVRRTVRYLDDKPGATHRVEGDALVLEGCGQDNCWIDYEVVVPAGFALAGDVTSGNVTVEGAGSVEVRSSSGDVTVRGVSGGVSVEATSGRIELVNVGENASVQVTSGDVGVRGVRGDATVRSSSGAVTVTGAGGRVDVEATSGDVAIDAAEVVDVTATATSGTLDITVPRARYRVAVEADSGEIDNAVGNDPAGQAALKLSASSGDVTVRYA
ncbi:DUF4097 domain-containing protein [Actinokineospora guangxiensis]|uniref:DUF4097 domain-containing protein n=1 Tax=Actinokineospora guangxiensis TaxID=1490288 RepID=A0ABW0EEB3_9PSEU